MLEETLLRVNFMATAQLFESYLRYLQRKPSSSPTTMKTIMWHEVQAKQQQREDFSMSLCLVKITVSAENSCFLLSAISSKDVSSKYIDGLLYL